MRLAILAAFGVLTSQSVEPADAGRVLAAVLTRGIGIITGRARDFADRPVRRAFRISLRPSFTESWQIPRFSRFWSAISGVELRLNPAEVVVDLRRDSGDIAARSGRYDWSGSP